MFSSKQQKRILQNLIAFSRSGKEKSISNKKKIWKNDLKSCFGICVYLLNDVLMIVYEDFFYEKATMQKSVRQTMSIFFLCEKQWKIY